MEIGKDNIKLYPNHTTPETLQTLVSYIKSLPEPELKAVHFKKDVEPSIQDAIEDIRDKSYKALTEVYLKDLGLKVKRVIFEEEGQIARYSQGINLPSHSDCPQWKFELPYFDLTTIMYVNDDYQGGEIYFEEFDYTYKPKSGELLIFPSYFLHETKVIKPLIGSTEYAQRASVPVFWSLEVEPL
jgi:hypothetical protein